MSLCLEARLGYVRVSEIESLNGTPSVIVTGPDGRRERSKLNSCVFLDLLPDSILTIALLERFALVNFVPELDIMVVVAVEVVFEELVAVIGLVGPPICQ